MPQYYFTGLPWSPELEEEAKRMSWRMHDRWVDQCLMEDGTAYTARKTEIDFFNDQIERGKMTPARDCRTDQDYER